jgi:hypothetical protein
MSHSALFIQQRTEMTSYELRQKENAINEESSKTENRRSLPDGFGNISSLGEESEASARETSTISSAFFDLFASVGDGPFDNKQTGIRTVQIRVLAYH